MDFECFMHFYEGVDVCFRHYRIFECFLFGHFWPYKGHFGTKICQFGVFLDYFGIDPP